MELGHLDLCLNVKNLRTSLQFYTQLGYQKTDGNLEENWIILKRKGSRIGLFEGHIRENLINFRGGNVFEIEKNLENQGLVFEQKAHEEPDGSISATLRDPDGNCIYFNTFPGEKPQFD